MRAAFALALIPLLLCACSKSAPAPVAQAAQLDCGLPFEALKAKVTSQPGLVQAPKEPGEPYEWYTAADQAASYVVTEPGAPGHPAILMQRAAQGRETTTGCPYGDKAGYAKVLAYVENLQRARK